MGRVNALASRLKKQGYLEPNFYRVHVAYFILTILLTTVILWGSGANGNSNDEDARFALSFIDALFLCTSAMTNTGLGTANLSSITAFQQFVLCILMLMGNITVVSTATILVRRHFIRRYMQDFLHRHEGGRKMLEDIAREENGKVQLSNCENNAPISTVRQRHPERQPEQTKTPEATYRSEHHEEGHGGLPYPWEWSVARSLRSKLGARGGSVVDRPHRYLSFKPLVDHRGRMHSLSEREREELGGVEYRALGVLLWLLPLYICFWLALSAVILIPWSYKPDVVVILDGPQPGRLNPGWWAWFLTVSGYTSCGLDLLDVSMIPFQPFYLVLIVIMAIKLAGNTFFPVFLRLTIWTMSKFLPPTSRLHHSLAFLLHHPRRCFILLFPAVNTWYLAAVQASLHIMLWIFWFLLQIDYPTVSPIPAGQKTIAGLFTALGVRNSGMYVISMSQVAPSLLVFYTGAMYVSALPIIISIRSTNIYEERSIGVHKQQNTDEDGKVSEKSYIGTHFQKQLASDAWWLFIGYWIICVVERTALAIPSPGFDLYAILFDTVSAFGTVGLSTGVPYNTYSFCGAWHTFSKLVLIVFMLRGRHRGLPMAIDRAVLLPGQELMERMDHEYNGARAKDEQEVRRDEEGAQAEISKEGQDQEQNAGTAEKVRHDKSEEDEATTG